MNEIERALEALERIEARLKPQMGDGPRYEQADMFPGGEDLPLFAGMTTAGDGDPRHNKTEGRS